MSQVPDAWQDDWSNAVDTPSGSTNPAEPKKISSKVTKAQRRAQQAEFNRQLWQEAEGPRETNYFLESRNTVPLRSEYKPPPVLLSRKGPSTKSSKPPRNGLDSLNLNQESSEDEDEAKTRELTLAERQAQSAKEREVKQRKYEERRQELFGTTVNAPQGNRSGTSTPNSLTPPGSRSSTPNRGRGRGRRGGSNQVQTQQPRTQQRELYEPSYAIKPDSAYIQRRENGTLTPKNNDILPIRTPKGPDGSGRGGFGFAKPRGGKQPTSVVVTDSVVDATT